MPRTNTATTARYAPESLDNARLANLCGAVDRNLRFIESLLGVRIIRRGGDFTIEGTGQAPRQAAALLARFYDRATEPVLTEDIQLASIPLNRSAHRAAIAANAAPPAGDELVDPADDQPVLRTRKGDLRGRTDNQHRYLRQILEHDITYGIGPAGTGKTYLAMAMAVAALVERKVKRIVLTRPAVEAGEKLGFLPGDIAEKVNPYLRPLHDALFDMVDDDKANAFIERGTVEVAPLAFMRGRTLNDAFIILDEAQNTTTEQMKMFLTRLGYGSKAVVTGDVTQVDLPSGRPSGLLEVQRVLKGVEGIAFCAFSEVDVVRHPLVQEVVRAYEAFEADKARASEERAAARAAERRAGAEGGGQAGG